MLVAGFKPSIYIPVELSPDECIKSPLYLAYHQGHFAPLAFYDEFSEGKLIDSADAAASLAGYR